MCYTLPCFPLSSFIHACPAHLDCCKLDHNFTVCFTLYMQVNLIIRWGSLLMVGVVLLLWRISVMGGSPPSFSSSDNPAANENSTLTRFLTFSHLPALNMLLLVFPRSLSFDWSMGSVPLLESASDGRNLITLVFYLSLAMLSWKVLSSLNGKQIITLPMCHGLVSG